MFALPENRIIRSALLACTVAITLGYAWLFAHVLEPSISLERSWLEGVAAVEGNTVIGWSDVYRRHSDEAGSVARQVKELDSALNMLGGLAQPVGILINFDQPDRLLVTDNRIEIGSNGLQSDGLVDKAVIKSWLLQNAGSGITSSHLRTEVVSDVISSLIFGDVGQVDPSTKNPLMFRRPVNWLSYMSSFKAVCGSAWKSLELEPLCAPTAQSEQATLLSFRPLLGAIVWRAFAAAPGLHRQELFTKWMTALKNETTASAVSATPNSLIAWRDSVRAEAQAIFPIEQERLQDSLKLAQLETDQGPHVDFHLHVSSVKPERAQLMALETGRKQGVSVLLETNGSWILLPGQVALAPVELRQLRSGESIWESCQGTRLGDFRQDSPAADEWMYIHSCGTSDVSYGPLWTDSLKAFSAANPDAGFLILRRPAVELAIRRRLLTPKTDLADLLDPENPLHLSSDLGLDSPTWVQDVGAYRVLGAIEAVQWMRTPDRAMFEPVN